MKPKITQPKKSLPQLQQELAKLKLDLKVDKLKDTSQLKKIKQQITLFLSKTDQPLAEKSL